MLADGRLLSAALLALIGGSKAQDPSWPSPYPESVNLSAVHDREGVGGFYVGSLADEEGLGYTLAHAGDINGDGIDDIIVGSYNIDDTGPGTAYVVFGSSEVLDSTFDLDTLDGTNGFKITGEGTSTYAGSAVSPAGDINNDGFGDVLVGAHAHTTGTGVVYVIFGGGAGSFASVLDLGTIDGSNGFSIQGDGFRDYLGYSCAAAGDVNKDGYDDIILGAPGDGPGGKLNAGSTFVIFGANSADLAGHTPLLVSSLTGANGFQIKGAAEDAESGTSVAGIGDINGDGYDDMALGAVAQTGLASLSGVVYVIFGRPAFAAVYDMAGVLSVSDGILIQGTASSDQIGTQLAAAGDVNGDGFADFLIGAPQAEDDSDTRAGAGRVYLIFGQGSYPSGVVLSSLSASKGLVLEGAEAADHAGSSVSAAGDINGDGYDDVIIGAMDAGSSRGSAYVLLGAETFSSPTVILDSLDGANGFELEGGSTSDKTGSSVGGSGDFNGDGFPDVLIGAVAAGAGGGGGAWVVYPQLLVAVESPTEAPVDRSIGLPACEGLGGACEADSGCCAVGGVDSVCSSSVCQVPPAARRDGTSDSDITEEEAPESLPVPGVSAGYVAKGRYADMRAEGGAISFGATAGLDRAASVEMSLHAIRELDADGAVVGAEAADGPHEMAVWQHLFTATEPTYGAYGGLSVLTTVLQAASYDGETSIKIIADVFQETGSVFNGRETLDVSPGALKVSYEIDGWPFCSVGGSGFSQCGASVNGTNIFQEGSLLELELRVLGPSLGEDVEGAAANTGKAFSLGGEDASVALVMSEWAYAQDMGWQQVTLTHDKDNSLYTVRVPRSAATLYYDPIISIETTPVAESQWLASWFQGVILTVVAVAGVGVGAVFTNAKHRSRAARKVEPSPFGGGTSIIPDPPGAASASPSLSTRVVGLLRGLLCLKPKEEKQGLLSNAERGKGAGLFGGLFGKKSSGSSSSNPVGKDGVWKPLPPLSTPAPDAAAKPAASEPKPKKAAFKLPSLKKEAKPPAVWTPLPPLTTPDAAAASTKSKKKSPKPPKEKKPKKQKKGAAPPEWKPLPPLGTPAQPEASSAKSFLSGLMGKGKVKSTGGKAKEAAMVEAVEEAAPEPVKSMATDPSAEVPDWMKGAMGGGSAVAAAPAPASISERKPSGGGMDWMAQSAAATPAPAPFAAQPPPAAAAAAPSWITSAAGGAQPWGS